jgi:hypothetical protein
VCEPDSNQRCSPDAPPHSAHVKRRGHTKIEFSHDNIVKKGVLVESSHSFFFTSTWGAASYEIKGQQTSSCLTKELAKTRCAATHCITHLDGAHIEPSGCEENQLDVCIGQCVHARSPHSFMLASIHSCSACVRLTCSWLSAWPSARAGACGLDALDVIRFDSMASGI